MRVAAFPPWQGSYTLNNCETWIHKQMKLLWAWRCCDREAWTAKSLLTVLLLKRNKNYKNPTQLETLPVNSSTLGTLPFPSRKTGKPLKNSLVFWDWQMAYLAALLAFYADVEIQEGKSPLTESLKSEGKKTSHFIRKQGVESLRCPLFPWLSSSSPALAAAVAKEEGGEHAVRNQMFRLALQTGASSQLFMLLLAIRLQTGGGGGLNSRLRMR